MWPFTISITPKNYILYIMWSVKQYHKGTHHVWSTLKWDIATHLLITEEYVESLTKIPNIIFSYKLLQHFFCLWYWFSKWKWILWNKFGVQYYISKQTFMYSFNRWVKRSITEFAGGYCRLCYGLWRQMAEDIKLIRWIKKGYNLRNVFLY